MCLFFRSGSHVAAVAGVVLNSDPCKIITPLVLVGLGLGVGEGLGLGNHIAISTRGVIIWQGAENGHNTGLCWDNSYPFVCSVVPKNLCLKG